MANLGSLMFQIGADTSRLRLAQREVESSASAMEYALGKVAKAVFSIGTAYAALRIGKEIVESGMELQRLQLAFQGITGSAHGSAQELRFVRSEADRLGQVFYSTADAYKLVSAAAKGTVMEGKGVRDIFSAVTEASTVLGLRSEETSGALYAIGQMMSKGKIMAEELRGQLGERLPGAFQLAAKAMNMTTAELDKFMADGKLMSADFLPKFAAALHERYGGSVAASAKSAQAQINRFSNAITDLKNLMATEALPAFTGFIQGLTRVIETFTKADQEGEKVLGVMKNIIALDGSRVGIDIDFQYVGKTPDEMIKEWNIGGSSSDFEGFLTKMKRRSQVWMAHLTQDPTGEKARQGIDVGHKYDWWQSGLQRQLEDQLRLSQRSASIDVFEASRKSRFGTEQTGAAAELAKFQKIVDTLNIPKIDSIKEKIAALWEVQMKTPGGVEDFDLKLQNLNDQLKKASESGAIGFEKIDDDVLGYRQSIMDAFQEITSQSAQNAIDMANNSGRFYDAERIKLDLWVSESEEAFKKRVSSLGQNVIDMEQALAKATASGKMVTPEAVEMVRNLRTEWEQLKASIPEYNKLVEESAASQKIQFRKDQGLGGQVELAQVNLQYTEMRGNMQGVYQAQLAMINASEAEKMANLNKDIPGLADAYRKLYDEQRRMADLQANGSFWDGMSEGLRQVRNETSSFKNGMDFARKGIDDLSGAMADMSMGVKTDFSSMTRSVIRDLIQIQLRMAMLSLFGVSSGAVSGGLFGFLSSLIGLGSSAGGGGNGGVVMPDRYYSGMAGGGTITEPVVGVGRSGHMYAFGEGGQAEDVVPRRGRSGASSSTRIEFFVDPNLRMRVDEGPTREEFEATVKSIYLRAMTGGDESFRAVATSFGNK